MEFFADIFEIKTISELIENIFNFIPALIRLFGNTFSFLGSGILTIITIGATIAIILRILGR